MVDSITTTDQILNAVPAHRVYLRENWADAWEEQPYLYCDTAAVRAAPEKSSAILHYDYGWILRQDQTQFQVFAPLDIAHWYVKIEIDWLDAEGEEAPILWYGILYDRDDDAYGSVQTSAGSGSGSGSGGGSGTPGGSGPKQTGTQKFTAYGMEAILERETIRTSRVANTLDGGGAPGESEFDVGRPLPFNREHHGDSYVVPNRSSNPGKAGAYLFTDDPLAGEPWSTSDIVKYLLSYKAPRDPAGNVQVPWQVFELPPPEEDGEEGVDDDEPTPSVIPTYDQPRIEVKTDSVKELLDKCLSRKRLISYYVSVTEADAEEEEGGEPPHDVVQLVPFTFLLEDLTVPTSYPNPDGSFTTGTATIPANPVQVALDFSEAFDIESVGLRHSAQEVFDQVIVRGARKSSTFTVSFLDGTLVIDWDSDLEESYIQAAAGQDDYPPTFALQQWRNQLFRSADVFKRVYRYFSVPRSWDGTANNGENTGEDRPVFPLDDDFSTSDTWCRRALLFSEKLPLYTDRDYSGDRIGDGTVIGLGIGSGSGSSDGSGGNVERLRPMAFLKIVSPDGEGWGTGSGSGSGSGGGSGDGSGTGFGSGSGSGSSRYQHVEKLSETAKTDKHALGGPAFTCSLRMQDRYLGVELNVHGAPQYMIAMGDFEPTNESDLTPVISYRNNLLCTLSAEADRFVEAMWPPAPDDEEDADDAGEDEPADPEEGEDEEPEVADFKRTLLIDLSHLEHGNALRLDYVVPGTVVALQDGLLVRSNGGYVRDDRGRLLALAQVAWLWYSVERRAFSLRYKQIDGQFALGDLITTIGPAGATQEVNTPITSIEWDMQAGTTTITTGFGELDFGNFL